MKANMKRYPLFKVHVDLPSAMNNIEQVLSSGYINEGEQVTQLTQKLSEQLKADNLLLVNSCTSALTLALHAAGVRFLDSVVSTPMTCIATNTPIHTHQADIVWADIDPDTGCIDPDSVDEMLDSDANIPAVIAVAWAGNPPKLDALAKICELHDTKFILDAAHAFGAEYKGEPIHEWADFTCYSMQAIKHVTSGDGGILVSRESDLHKRVNNLKWFGIDRTVIKDSEDNWKGQSHDFDVLEAGYKFNMNNLSAALGLSQIPHIQKILDAHRANAAFYDRLLRDNAYIESLQTYEDAISSHWVYGVRMRPKYVHLRDELLKRLNDMGIEAGQVHVPNHVYTCFIESLAHLPGVEQFSSSQFALPCGWWITESDVQFITKTLNELCDAMIA